MSLSMLDLAQYGAAADGVDGLLVRCSPMWDGRDVMSEINPVRTDAPPKGVIHPVGAVVWGLAFAVASTLVVFGVSLALASLWSSAVSTENAGTDPWVLVVAFNTYVVTVSFVVIYCLIVPIYYVLSDEYIRCCITICCCSSCC